MEEALIDHLSLKTDFLIPLKPAEPALDGAFIHVFPVLIAGRPPEGGRLPENEEDV
jgi:hypothetical protein